MSTRSPEPAGLGARGAGGRQRLIAAALELASTTRSLASLGLREVTRSAGLAPNSFYRHFRSFDELGLAAVDMLGGELRRGLRERRRRLATPPATPLATPQQVLAGSQSLIGETVGLVLDFVAEHPTAFIVGMRELNGSSPVMRRAVQQLMEDFATDMAEDVQALMSFANLGPAALQEISRQVIRQMMFFSMDYLEQPQRRRDIRAQAEHVRQVKKFESGMVVNPITIAPDATLHPARVRGRDGDGRDGPGGEASRRICAKTREKTRESTCEEGREEICGRCGHRRRLAPRQSLNCFRYSMMSARCCGVVWNTIIALLGRKRVGLASQKSSSSGVHSKPAFFISSE